MSKDEELEIGLDDIPGELFLNIGELTEKTTFTDLVDVTWSWQPQGKYDLQYVYIDTYQKILQKYHAYKMAAENAIAQNAEYRYYIKKALKAQNPKRILKNYMESFED